MKNAKTLTEGPLAKQILLVSLPLALSNLLDKQYWRSASMPGAPRSVLLSVNYQF